MCVCVSGEVVGSYTSDCCSRRCQAVQEEGVGESGGALRLQRLRLPDGDDRPCQTAQLHRWRSEAMIHVFIIPF